MTPMDAQADDVNPSGPSLWQDLRAGTARAGVRTVVALAAGVFLAGAALVAAYVLAAFIPGFNRTAYNYVSGRPVPMRPSGVFPKDSVVAGLMMLAGAAWMACILWLFFRGIRQRPLAKPIVITFAITVVAFGLGLMVDSSLRGDQELVIAGIVLVAIAAVMIVWLQAIQRVRTGRPLRNRQDQLLDIRCPECGYRMVGLHESRCPECGKAYTLDELLARQNFARAETRTPPPISPGPPQSAVATALAARPL
jgi:DNA-directed RNA polymerase subunit RPC12/RpoP